MAKTVFGMPGVGNKPGDDDNTSKESTAASGSASSSTQSPNKTPLVSPSRPNVAKPVSAPMARPMGPASGGGAPAAGNRTVFGMPAVKVPVQSQPPAARPVVQETAKDELRPMYSPAQSLSTTGPRGAAVAKPSESQDKAAFKATMVGMAAVRPEDGTPSWAPDAAGAAAPPMEMNATPPRGIPSIDDIAADEPARAMGAPYQSDTPKPKKKQYAQEPVYAAPPVRSNTGGILIVIATILVSALILAGRYFLFSDEPPPAPAMVAPPVPGIPGVSGVPGVPPVPPIPGTVPAGVPSAAPQIPVAPPPVPPPPPAQ
jgi:hypothetical protein